MNKSFLKSKTLWFNFVNGIVFLATTITPDQLPFHVPADFAKWQATILMLGNFFLRFSSSTAITLTAPEKDQP